jgi:Domain of unknown function (DUF1772)
MLVGTLALTSAAAFTGAAIYVTAAEQPARLELDNSAALRQWKPSYSRGFAMQASLALAAALFGLLEMWLSRDWRWLIGSALIFANWPYTLIVILPVNKVLETTSPDMANDETRALIATWGRLHAVRSLLGLAATLVFMWALG